MAGINGRMDLLVMDKWRMEPPCNGQVKNGPRSNGQRNNGPRSNGPRSKGQMNNEPIQSLETCSHLRFLERS